MSRNVHGADARTASPLRETVRRAVVVLALALSLASCGSSEQPRAAGPGAVSQAETVSYVSGAPEGDLRTVPVKLGKIVTLTVTSDVAGEVRVDGYDLTRPIQPGKPEYLIFSADTPGTFDVRLRKSGADVSFAQIEVED